jgi:hypothetical protein
MTRARKNDRLFVQFKEVKPQPRKTVPRITLIKRRAALLNADFVGDDPASLTRAPNEEELQQRERAGAAAGAAWVGRGR